MNDDVVSIAGLKVHFGRQSVLDGLDLQLAPGKVTVLLGTNGAGKSTLLRVLLGILRPLAGRVRVFGVDPLRAHRAVVQRVGYVPDIPDAYPSMTPAALFNFLTPHYPRWDADSCASLCARLRIPMRTRLASLSRGEAMKVMLAAALASSPDLLLLDEPFAGLDPIVREEVLQAIVGELRDGERTVLCATHELEIAARIADRVAVLQGGCIVRHGDLGAVLGVDGEAASVPAQLHRVLVEAASAAASDAAPRSASMVVGASSSGGHG